MINKQKLVEYLNRKRTRAIGGHQYDGFDDADQILTWIEKNDDEKQTETPKFEVIKDLGFVAEQECCVMYIQNPKFMTYQEFEKIFTKQFPLLDFAGFHAEYEGKPFELFYMHKK